MDRVSHQPRDGNRLRDKKKSSPNPDKNREKRERKEKRRGEKKTKKGEVESVSAL